MKKKLTQKGYIALITVILVSASLLTVVLAVSHEGFFSRFGVLESLQKEQSAYLAESCINTAILKIAQDTNYLENTTKTIKVGIHSCEIISISTGSVFMSNRVIKSQGRIGDVYTNLVVEMDPSKLPLIDIVSWAQLARF